MNNLTISLSVSSTENVSTAIITKLYNLALSSNVADPNNSFNMSISGNITATYAKLNLVEYLRTKFSPNLVINVTDGYYLDILDPAWELIIATRYGDGVGVTSGNLNTVTSYDTSLFNSTEVLILDMKNFTNLYSSSYAPAKNINNNAFNSMPNVTEIYLATGYQICTHHSNLLSKIDKFIVGHCNLLKYGATDQSTNTIGTLAVKNVDAVSYSTFYKGVQIGKFYVGNSTPPSSADNRYNCNINRCEAIYVPTGSISSYQAATMWQDYTGLYIEYDFDNDPDNIFKGM